MFILFIRSVIVAFAGLLDLVVGWDGGRRVGGCCETVLPETVKVDQRKCCVFPGQILRPGGIGVLQPPGRSASPGT